jgi:hypothetical protein
MQPLFVKHSTHLAVVRRMVRLERARRCTRSDGLKHWRVHFQEAVFFEYAPDCLDHGSACGKKSAGRGIDQEVYVAIAKRIYIIFETKVRFRKCVEAGGEQLGVTSDKHELACWRMNI